jgi:predicted secreted hydrolase
MSTGRLELLARVMDARATRRHALHGVGLSGIALAAGLRGAAAGSASGSAYAVAHRQATPATGIGLDALDPGTKDNVTQALWLAEWDADAIPAAIRERLASEKNSNAAYGERMAARLQALIGTPETFTPSHADRYAALLDHCGALSAHQVYCMANLLGPDGASDFPPLPPRADFGFPRSHAVDLPMQVGWYFVVGSCGGDNGKEYGVEMMFFRNAILPPALMEAYGLTHVENQITELHFAVTEAGGEHHRAIPTVIAGTTGLLEFAPDGLGWSMGNNTIESLDPGIGAMPLHFRARGVNRGGETPIDFSVDITCSEPDMPVPQGVDGCDPCCDGAGTLYYSIPGLRLDPAKSTLTIDGEEIELVSGQFWFDHQWGTSLVASPRSEVTRAAKNVGPVTVAGWDWFMGQFDSGHQLAGGALHTAENMPFYFQDGDTPPGPMEAPVKGRLMVGDGSVKLIEGTVLVDDWVRSTGSPDPALYWPTNTWYPNHWRYTFGDDVPEEVRTFTMEPIVAGGQSGFFASGAQYSEGAVILRDVAGNEIGRGFGESVNYADTIANIMALAGLPDTAEMREALAQRTPSDELIAESMAYVVGHQDELNAVIASCIGI